MSVEVLRSDFPGKNGERNYNIVRDWASYTQPRRNRGKGIKGVLEEGSYSWLALKHGVTQRVCIGIVWRWRHAVAKRTKRPPLKIAPAEPYRPRTSY